MDMPVVAVPAPTDLLAVALVRRAAKDGTARRVRQLAEVSIAELARSCDVEPQTIMRWEKGTRSPRTRAGERYTAAIIALVAMLRDTDEPSVRNLATALGIGPSRTMSQGDDPGPSKTSGAGGGRAGG